MFLSYSVIFVTQTRTVSFYQLPSMLQTLFLGRLTSRFSSSLCSWVCGFMRTCSSLYWYSLLSPLLFHVVAVPVDSHLRILLQRQALGFMFNISPVSPTNPFSPCMPWWPHRDKAIGFYSWREAWGSPFPGTHILLNGSLGDSSVGLWEVPVSLSSHEFPSNNSPFPISVSPF